MDKDMKVWAGIFIGIIVLSSCDSAEERFEIPPGRILLLESPAARDTLVVNTPFLLVGTLDIEVNTVQVQVLAGSKIYLNQKIEYVQVVQPLLLNEMYTINVLINSSTPIPVNLRLSWNDGNQFVEVPLYLKG
jgi:hypothetical protein